MIRNKIKDNYVGQEIRNQGFAKLKGSVISSDPLTNTCSVIYTDQMGNRQTESAMHVQTNSVDSWFPKPGEYVIIEAWQTRIQLKQDADRLKQNWKENKRFNEC